VERVKAIDRLAPWGATTLYDVIIRGVDLLGRQSGRKAMIVFTDGEDEGSRAPLEEVVRRLEASDVTLYLIGQGRGTEMERLKKIMVQLAQPTGGRALFTEKIDDLRAAFGELLDELANQYLLGYAPPDNRHLDVLHHLKVEVDGHRNVRARQTYRVAPAVKP
jgi:VWFA-related protein